MMNDMSMQAKEVLSLLTKKQRRIIRKNYPLKNRRDDAIRTLKAQGVKAELLAEVTGLSESTIFRIVKDPNNAPDNLNGTLRSLKGVFDAFYKAVVLVLSKGQGKGGGKG